VYYLREWVISNAKPKYINTAAILIFKFSLLLVRNGRGVTSQTTQNVFIFFKHSNLDLVYNGIHINKDVQK